jgi:hypothetical protein
METAGKCPFIALRDCRLRAIAGRLPVLVGVASNNGGGIV